MYSTSANNKKIIIMESNNVHLVKAAFHTQFRVAMETCGISADHYFKKVNLPTEVSNPESLVPLMPFYSLINMVAINENIPDFGSQVARITPWHKVASLGPLIKNSNNLKGLLTTFCEVASGQSSPVIFSVKDEGSHFSFCYTNTLLFKGEIQMELYRITSMIQLVQLAASSVWRPETIRLIMPKSDIVYASPLLSESEIRFSQADSAISIPNNFLQLPVQINIPEFIEHNDKEQADLNIEFVKSIRQIIDTYTATNNTSIEEIADATNLSVRTLQRRLTDNGLKFHDLLNEAKFEHAKEK
ncbi:MAG: AraC family transcriptional regulator ligand-binding domain-containing protein, partial [Pseudomonadota bacterium]|nr:AraC family transcriptional regulator ligand-binding domain-containing protein [Pseudomonadota bacterium]